MFSVESSLIPADGRGVLPGVLHSMEMLEWLCQVRILYLVESYHQGTCYECQASPPPHPAGVLFCTFMCGE